MLRALADAADKWLRRPRNPQADEEVLEGVQRRQEPPPAEPEAPPAPTSPVLPSARLLRLVGQQAQESWELPTDRPVLVGRSGKQGSSLDIDLWPDASVSRRHALLWFDGEGWCIEDLRSTNGTFLDDLKIRGQRVTHVAMGTRVQCGRTLLLLAPDEDEKIPSAESQHDAQEC